MANSKPAKNPRKERNPAEAPHRDAINGEAI